MSARGRVVAVTGAGVRGVARAGLVSLLSLLSLAVFVAGGVAGAQVTGRDSATAVARSDSSRRRPRADSIQARIGRGGPPATLDVGASYTYTRDEFYALGAFTLGDLLERIPGATAYRTGWLAAPQAAAYLGDFARVRVFFDGIELDNLDARTGGAFDPSTVPLWTLERVTVERGATELRVDVRSWEYNRTTPYTRTDVYTGDPQTTMYRAFYGKRYYNGAGLQVAAQQFSVTGGREGGGGDQTGALVRYGVGRRRWSLDGTFYRSGRTRSVTRRIPLPEEDFEGGGDPGDPLAGYRSTNTVAYLRGAIGRDGDGPFLQVVASTLALRERSSHTDASTAAGIPVDTVDTLRSRAQYVATAGFDRGGLRLRLIDRYRVGEGRTFNSGTASAELTRSRLALSAAAERDPYFGVTRLEAAGRIVPLPFLAVAAAVGARNTDEARSFEPDSRSARLEAGLRLRGGLWVTAGAVARDTAVLIPPAVFDTALRPRVVSSTSGAIASLKGPIWNGFSVDAVVTRWSEPTPYLPRYQTRSELRYFTQWLSRFPQGNFSFLLAPWVEYRSRAIFPVAGAEIRARPSTVYSVLAELRILRAVITFERRNLGAVIYDQVPGFVLPRSNTIYGVRWYFFD